MGSNISSLEDKANIFDDLLTQQEEQRTRIENLELNDSPLIVLKLNIARLRKLERKSHRLANDLGPTLLSKVLYRRTRTLTNKLTYSNDRQTQKYATDIIDKLTAVHQPTFYTERQD